MDTYKQLLKYKNNTKYYISLILKNNISELYTIIDSIIECINSNINTELMYNITYKILWEIILFELYGDTYINHNKYNYINELNISKLYNNPETLFYKLFSMYKTKIKQNNKCKIEYIISNPPIKICNYITNIIFNNIDLTEDINIFKKYKNLKYLDISDNELNLDIYKDNLIEGLDIQYLNCSNSLISIDNIIKLHNLNTLICRNCYFDNNINKCKNLIYLDCSSCYNIDTLNNLINLKKLICQNTNNIQINNLINLKYLDCSKTNKSILYNYNNDDLSQLINLEYLNIYNQEKLTNSVISNMLKLKEVISEYIQLDLEYINIDCNYDLINYGIYNEEEEIDFDNDSDDIDNNEY